MQNNNTKVKHHFLKLMTGSDLSQRKIPIISIESGLPGPVVWITACGHGDEVTGIVIVQELMKYLKKYGLECGSIYMIPIMNPIGFENVSRHIPFSDEDLNRAFPGKENGTLAERIAFKIFTAIMDTSPDLVIDLHNDWINSIPYALVDPFDKDRSVYDQAMHYAKLSGFIVVRDNDLLRSSLSHAMLTRGIPSITLELGESYIVSERNVQYGLYALLNILSYHKMSSLSSGFFKYPLPGRLEDMVLVYSDKPLCTVSGIIRFIVKPGVIVRRGKVIARVYNVFGRVRETMVADTDGFVLGHTDSSLAFPGALVMAFGNIY